MNLHRLKLLHWTKILLISILTTLIIAILELLLEQVLVNSYNIYAIRETLYSDTLGSFLMPLTIALGEGALAVYIGEQRPLRTVFNTSSLWILVICLYLGLFMKFLLIIPPILVCDSIQMTSIGIWLGVFLKGEKYWRYFRRWR